MKIRYDFVTNSSSTSFVIISKGKPCKEEFLEAIGIKANSPLASFFEELFHILNRKMSPLEEAIKSGYWKTSDSTYEFIKREFSETTAKRVILSAEEGKSVWIGRLNSDEDMTESFFCCESIEVDHSSLYIDAVQCGW